MDQGAIEKMLRLLKNSFSRREKHKHECNQTCNSTKDPNNILTSQKLLLTRKKNVKHIDPKTHTHTHTHTHTLFQKQVKTV